MKISFHTDAFNTSFVSFDHCLEWARENDVHWIECGLIDGVSWIHGLGYQPHVAICGFRMSGIGSQIPAISPSVRA
jgi:hypothetical protein